MTRSLANHEALTTNYGFAAGADVISGDADDDVIRARSSQRHHLWLPLHGLHRRSDDSISGGNWTRHGVGDLTDARTYGYQADILGGARTRSRRRWR
jgi:hypothetical protein